MEAWQRIQEYTQSYRTFTTNLCTIQSAPERQSLLSKILKISSLEHSFYTIFLLFFAEKPQRSYKNSMKINWISIKKRINPNQIQRKQRLRRALNKKVLLMIHSRFTSCGHATFITRNCASVQLSHLRSRESFSILAFKICMNMSLYWMSESCLSKTKCVDIVWNTILNKCFDRLIQSVHALVSLELEIRFRYYSQLLWSEFGWEVFFTWPQQVST